jgi:hypothetical protein
VFGILFLVFGVGLSYINPVQNAKGKSHAAQRIFAWRKIGLSQKTLSAMRRAPCRLVSRAMHIALNSVPAELIQ